MAVKNIIFNNFKKPLKMKKGNRNIIVNIWIAIEAMEIENFSI